MRGISRASAASLAQLRTQVRAFALSLLKRDLCSRTLQKNSRFAMFGGAVDRRLVSAGAGRCAPAHRFASLAVLARDVAPLHPAQQRDRPPTGVGRGGSLRCRPAASRTLAVLARDVAPLHPARQRDRPPTGVGRGGIAALPPTVRCAVTASSVRIRTYPYSLPSYHHSDKILILKSIRALTKLQY